MHSHWEPINPSQIQVIAPTTIHEIKVTEPIFRIEIIIFFELGAVMVELYLKFKTFEVLTPNESVAATVMG